MTKTIKVKATPGVNLITKIKTQITLKLERYLLNHLLVPRKKINQMNISTQTTPSLEVEASNVCQTSELPPYYWIFALAFGLAAMTGYGLVILINIRKKVTRNSTNIIITNLAVVDFR